jgi:hypothetical protein
MSTENRVGDIFLTKDESTCRALYRPLDGTPDVLLCAMELSVYERHTFVREQFANLAAEIAINLDRPAGAGITVQHVPVRQPSEPKTDRAGFACWDCKHPQAPDARQWLRSLSDGDLVTQMSPAGTPLFCCRVAPVGAVAR